MKSFFKVVVVILVIIGLGTVVKSIIKSGPETEVKPKAKNTILQLELNGVILNGKKFLTRLKSFKEDEHIKALVININSPGGAVGPSQELSYEIERFKTEKKIPVVCVSTGIIASGAYYAAIPCDKIIVAPGALVGSIGVIMEFANLEKLYEWAHIQRFVIKSGKFKDSGAEFRSMSEEERQYFQDLINETYRQFRKTVMEGRKLNDEVMDRYADGRVFNGSQAVEWGFADKVGYVEDAVLMAAELANLGKDYELFEIKKRKKTFFDLVLEGEENEDDLNSFEGLSRVMNGKGAIDMSQMYREVLRADYLNQPMYLMPGFWK